MDHTDPGVNTSDDLRAADGRVPGRRGRATRERLIACTLNMLQETSYRDLKVVDIAREAGTSPATFYQYFPDVESALVSLVEQMAEDGNHRLTRIVGEGDWRLKYAYDTCAEIVAAFFAFWDDNAALMRVLDLTSAEGDTRFRSIRTKLLNEWTVELADLIGRFRDAGKHPADINPMAVAGILVSMLSHTAGHRNDFAVHGIAVPDTQRALERLLYSSICGAKPTR